MATNSAKNSANDLPPATSNEEMYVRSKLRPPNFEALPLQEQWAVDRRLGIADWDGTWDPEKLVALVKERPRLVAPHGAPALLIEVVGDRVRFELGAPVTWFTLDAVKARAMALAIWAAADVVSGEAQAVPSGAIERPLAIAHQLLTAAAERLSALEVEHEAGQIDARTLVKRAADVRSFVQNAETQVGAVLEELAKAAQAAKSSS